MGAVRHFHLWIGKSPEDRELDQYINQYQATSEGKAMVGRIFKSLGLSWFRLRSEIGYDPPLELEYRNAMAQHEGYIDASEMKIQILTEERTRLLEEVERLREQNERLTNRLLQGPQYVAALPSGNGNGNGHAPEPEEPKVKNADRARRMGSFTAGGRNW